MRSRQLIAAVCGLLSVGGICAEAVAGPSVGVTAGTTGFGADVNFPILPMLDVRGGYSAFVYHHDITETDVDYAGRLHFSEASGLVDFYPLIVGFRLTAGIYAGNTTVDITGQPSYGSYSIGGTTYTSTEVSKVQGQLKFGNTIKPYVGIGWGNPNEGFPVTFTVDLGAIYGGVPSVSLGVECGSAAPPGSAACDEAQSSIASERAQLESKVTVAKWYPVLNVGMAFRFF